MLVWSEQRSDLKPFHTHTNTDRTTVVLDPVSRSYCCCLGAAASMVHQDSAVIHSDQQHDSRDAHDPDAIVLLGCLTRPIRAEVVVCERSISDLSNTAGGSCHIGVTVSLLRRPLWLRLKRGKWSHLSCRSQQRCSDPLSRRPDPLSDSCEGRLNYGLLYFTIQRLSRL